VILSLVCGVDSSQLLGKRSVNAMWTSQGFGLIIVPAAHVKRGGRENNRAEAGGAGRWVSQIWTVLPDLRLLILLLTRVLLAANEKNDTTQIACWQLEFITSWTVIDIWFVGSSPSRFTCWAANCSAFNLVPLVIVSHSLSLLHSGISLSLTLILCASTLSLALVAE